MISIILALAVAQLFLGVADLVKRRDRVRFFPPHVIWVVNLFILIFLHWWSLWTFRDLPWNFAMFFYSLMAPSLMFFTAAMLSPRDLTSGATDISAHFLNNRQLFLSVFMILVLLSAMDGPLFGTEKLFNGLRALQIFIFVITGWGLMSKSPRVQLTVSLVILAGLSAVCIYRFLPGQ